MTDAGFTDTNGINYAPADQFSPANCIGLSTSISSGPYFLAPRIGGEFGSGGGGIIVPETGVYQLSVSLASRTSGSTAQRANVAVRFMVSNDDNEGTFPLEEYGASAYIRSSSGHNDATSSITTIAQLNAGQRVQVQFGRFGQSGRVVMRPNNSTIFITKIAD